MQLKLFPTVADSVAPGAWTRMWLNPASNNQEMKLPSSFEFKRTNMNASCVKFA